MRSRHIQQNSIGFAVLTADQKSDLYLGIKRILTLLIFTTLLALS